MYGQRPIAFLTQRDVAHHRKHNYRHDPTYRYPLSCLLAYQPHTFPNSVQSIARFRALLRLPL